MFIGAYREEKIAKKLTRSKLLLKIFFIAEGFSHIFRTLWSCEIMMDSVTRPENTIDMPTTEMAQPLAVLIASNPYKN